MTDSIALKLHNIDVVRLLSLSHRRRRSILASMSTTEYAYTATLLLSSSTTNELTSCWPSGTECKQTFHSLCVGLEYIDSNKRILLSRKCRLRVAVKQTCLPFLSNLTGFEDLHSLLFDRNHGSATFQIIDALALSHRKHKTANGRFNESAILNYTAS
jgi:hypothetical protein